MILGSGRRQLVPGPSSGSSAASSGNHVDSNPDTHPVESNAEAEETSNGLEPWVEWIQRTTRQIEHQLETYKIDNWITKWRKRVWTWAARVASYDDFRWARRALEWCPATTSPLCRRQARPRKRWDQDIVDFLVSTGYDTAATTWIHVAQDSKLWTSLADQFAGSSLSLPCCRSDAHVVQA